MSIITDFLIVIVLLTFLLEVARINLDLLFLKEQILNKIKILLAQYPDRPNVSKYKIGNKRYVAYEDYYKLFKFLTIIRGYTESVEVEPCQTK